MRKGEKWIFGIMAASILGMGLRVVLQQTGKDADNPGNKRIPFYSTATPRLARQSMELIRRNSCRDCHTLWTIRDPLQAVPAPALDGVGSLHDEAWLFDYLSAASPQTILPSRLKKEYRMPSYAYLPESERRVLVSYLASLKVEPWYLQEVKKSEYEKLTGKDYRP